MAESYVKALYDYHSGEVGDLSFNAEDVIKVLNQIDENWIKGEHGGKTGLFPANFVEPFTNNETSKTESSFASGKTVVAKETYISGDDGVLTFFRGDELTFLGWVDDYWCRGSYLGEVGLFPAHMVDGLDDDLMSPHVNDNVITSGNIKESRQQGTTTIESYQESVTQQALHEPHAKTLFEFKGLSDFELSFPANEIIGLTKDVDEEWFEGSYNGSVGIFPKSFVEVVVPLSQSPVALSQASSNAQSLYDSQVSTAEKDDIDVPYAIAIYPFVGETSSELSFREGEVIFLHHWVSSEWIQGECNGQVGIFPSTFVQVQKKLEQEFQEDSGTTISGSSQESSHSLNSVFKTGDTALAIYSYNTDIDGDLQLQVGDLIWIEQIIDDEWVLGQKDESVGLCPAVFLELQQHQSEVNAIENGYSNVEETIPGSMNTQSFPSTNDKALVKEKFDTSEKLNDKTAENTNLTQNEYRNTSQITDSMNAKTTSLITEMNSATTLDETRELKSNHVVSSKPQSNTTPEIFLSPASPTSIVPQKQTIQSTNRTKPSKPTTLSLGPNPPLAPKPLISPKPDFLKKQVKPVPLTAKPVLPPKPVTPTEKSPGFSKTNGNKWVTFEDHNETPTSTQSSQSRRKPTPPKRSSKDSPSMSYKTLLDKSIEEELASTIRPKQNKGRPVPPPRVDLGGSRSSTPDMLSSKLMEQAELFEKSNSRQSSPSLNELRDLAKSQRPVPAKRNKQPEKAQNLPDQGFPILNEFDEQIKKLNNELQKENKVLSGVEVLIQSVNKDTAKYSELESNKGITQRKIEDLNRQLKKAEGQKKRLLKLLDGYSSQGQIQLKIQQLQQSIKENTDTKDKLQTLLSECEEEDVQRELQDNILFCSEAIKNITSELSSLEDLVALLEGKIFKDDEKDVTHRKKVIDEILNTEKSFARDLNLCLKHFMMQLIDWKVEKIDCDLLFGNMDEVAALSSRLLERLETATKDININNQIIGTCFVDFSDEITVVYGQYCRNHDEAITFLEKSANDEEIQQYFSKCLESIREFSNCWDLSSFLIKPVQRILKYPLLLNELLKNTPDNHPDKPGLIKAIDVMTTAANDVNEFKRRKELVQKYQKVEESRLSTKFQKFTWHSVVKKSSRFNQRITQFTGLVSQTVDQKFNENEKLFYHIEKTAKNFIKNITQYIEQFEVLHESQIQTCENITDFCKENTTEKDIQEYNVAQKYIGEDLVNQLKFVLDEEVISPLNTLINLFQGPHRLILKRHDKCLDYDSWSNKVEKIKDSEKRKQAKDEFEFAKKNYEALNAQLLDELPLLNAKSMKFLKTCISNFACVHKNFFVEALDRFSSSVQLSVMNSENMDIISDYFSQNQVASHDVFQRAFTPKQSLTLGRPVRPNISPKASRTNLSVNDKYLKTRSLTRSASESKRKAPLPPTLDTGNTLPRSRTVSAADRSLLLRKRIDVDLESGNSTYIVKYAFKAEAPTELSVNKDDVVRVVQYNDAFGHNEWWKVEHNGKIGFVPSSFLAPYTSISMVPLTGDSSIGRKSSQTGLSRSGQAGDSGMGSNTGQTNLVSKSGQLGNGNVMNGGNYFVKYDFESHGSSELGVVSGEVVTVIKDCDSSGSNEWWLVEARGERGYVPASYLVKGE